MKRLEAFYQLFRARAARLAAESINVDYITHFSFFSPSEHCTASTTRSPYRLSRCSGKRGGANAQFCHDNPLS